MSKSTIVDKAGISNTVGNSVSKKIEVPANEKRYAIGFPVVLSGLMASTIGIGSVMSSLPLTDVLIGLGAVGSVLTGATTLTSILNIKDARNEALQKACGKEILSKIPKNNNNKVLVNSFYIREAIEIEPAEWINPNSIVTKENATHMVNHHLIKDKKGYRLEQEVIANEETIWDLSANALVEVYGVKEVNSVEA